MLDAIDKKLNEDITLHMLARAAGYSPWYSERIFKEITGRSPFQYVRSIRLSRAALELKYGNRKVVDVAFDYMFDSHEGFTRAFSRQFGVSPRLCAQTGDLPKLFFPSSARDYYLKMIRGENGMQNKANVHTIFVQVIERPSRKFICKPAKKADNFFAYCEEVGCEIWDTLTKVKDALYEPIGVWMPENLRRFGTSKYFQGVEVASDYKGEVPAGCEVIELPPCKMMVFQGPPYDDSDFQEAIGTFWQEMETYNPEIYGFRWALEDGPRFQMAPEGWRGYIEARPVRQINS